LAATTVAVHGGACIVLGKRLHQAGKADFSARIQIDPIAPIPDVDAVHDADLASVVV
jgi:hypothetical protein